MKMDGGIYEARDENGPLQSIPIEGVKQGIVGIITNHSWLANTTFRGMRQSILSSFDQVYVIDLHGSTNPREIVPPGQRNENVFDVKKGVAIALLVKNSGTGKGAWHAEFWGSRQEKYLAAAENSVATVTWKKITPQAPNWLLNQLKADSEVIPAHPSGPFAIYLPHLEILPPVS